MEFLLDFDRWLFLLINTKLTAGWMDVAAPVLRNKLTWIPFYALASVYVVMKYELRGLIAIGFVVITVGVCDQVSSTIVKSLFARIRPCNDESLHTQARLLLSHCSGGYSFTSSHAANHAGLAAAAFFIFNIRFAVASVLFIWAAVVAYCQVYVGVHYPFDIVGGFVLGIILSKLIAVFYKKIISASYQINATPI
jgi:membrane-associated phospholipid phosphatase